MKNQIETSELFDRLYHETLFSNAWDDGCAEISDRIASLFSTALEEALRLKREEIDVVAADFESFELKPLVDDLSSLECASVYFVQLLKASRPEFSAQIDAIISAKTKEFINDRGDDFDALRFALAALVAANESSKKK